MQVVAAIATHPRRDLAVSDPPDSYQCTHSDEARHPPREQYEETRYLSEPLLPPSEGPPTEHEPDNHCHPHHSARQKHRNRAKTPTN
jgi:hypothetical protein